MIALNVVLTVLLLLTLAGARLVASDLEDSKRNHKRAIDIAERAEEMYAPKRKNAWDGGELDTVLIADYQNMRSDIQTFNLYICKQLSMLVQHEDFNFDPELRAQYNLLKSVVSDFHTTFEEYLDD